MKNLGFEFLHQIELVSSTLGNHATQVRFLVGQIIIGTFVLLLVPTLVFVKGILMLKVYHSFVTF